MISRVLHRYFFVIVKLLSFFFLNLCFARYVCVYSHECMVQYMSCVCRNNIKVFNNKFVTEDGHMEEVLLMSTGVCFFVGRCLMNIWLLLTSIPALFSH